MIPIYNWENKKIRDCWSFWLVELLVGNISEYPLVALNASRKRFGSILGYWALFVFLGVGYRSNTPVLLWYSRLSGCIKVLQVHRSSFVNASGDSTPLWETGIGIPSPGVPSYRIRIFLHFSEYQDQFLSIWHTSRLRPCRTKDFTSAFYEFLTN